MLKRTTRAVLLVVGLLAAGTACSDDPGDPGGDPANISLVDGNDQEAEAGTALPAPLRVLVTDDDGVPLEGITVEWNVATGTGSVPPSTVTGFDGVASATFTLGPEIGEQIARAELDGVSGSPVVFSATATGDAQPAIQLVSVIPIPADYGIHDTFVRDGLAFVFAWNTGVRIYDVGNGIRSGTPAVPQLVGAWSQVPPTAGW